MEPREVSRARAKKRRGGWNVIWKRITENFDDAVRRAGADPGIAVPLLHQWRLEALTPSSSALSNCSACSPSERGMIRELVMAGLSRAKADGTQLGRRRLEDSDANKVAAIVRRVPRGPGSAASLANLA